MTRNFAVCLTLSWAALVFGSNTGRAQDPILAELYGSGVHEYFSGGYQQAIADLSQAIDNGSKDPRVFYFRALAYLRTGDTSKAQTDFTSGAKMESADVNGYYPVSKSLERVQGSGRLTLERYRVQARAEAYRRQEKRNLARYEAQRKAEADVLRATPPPPAAGEIAPPAAAKPPAEKVPAEEPAAEMPADEPDPFADEPAAEPDANAMPADEPAAEPDADAAPAEESDADASSPADEMPEDSSESMEEDSK